MTFSLGAGGELEFINHQIKWSLVTLYIEIFVHFVPQTSHEVRSENKGSLRFLEKIFIYLCTLMLSMKQVKFQTTGSLLRSYHSPRNQIRKNATMSG